MNKSNQHLLALGVSEHREGSAIAEGGIVLTAEGFVQAFDSSMRWSSGSGDNEVSGVCQVGDIYKSTNKKHRKAILASLCENYGITGELSAADAMALQRGFTIAAALRAGVDVKFVKASVERKGAAVSVRAAEVPASIAFTLTDKEGNPTDIAKEAVERAKSNLELEGKAIPDDAVMLERIGKLRIKCVGGRHAVFGRVPSASGLAAILRPFAVEGGFMAPPSPRNSSPKAEQFWASLEYAAKCLDLLAGDGDESEFAPSDALHDKMRALAEKIAAYFAALPEGDSDKLPFDAD